MPNLQTQHQKIIQQLKYLLSLNPSQTKQDIQQLLNKIHPFINYPLDFHIPVQLFQILQQQKLISQDLKKQLNSYCFVVLRGSLVIQRQNNIFTQQKYLDDDNIREKTFYNFDQGVSHLKGKFNCVYLKIHNIWIKKCKKNAQKKEKDYIRKKLIQVDFFSQLTFQEFDNICNKAYFKHLGPEQILIKQDQTPYHMYIVAEGELMIQKRVKFIKQQNTWNQVKSQLIRNNNFCQQLFIYLVRNPSSKDQIFEIDFNLKQIHTNQIICGKQTLFQHSLKYSIKSTLKTKLICIKYPDIYLLKEDRLASIRGWPFLCEIDEKKLRMQYYSLVKWENFKQFLRKENQLSKIQKKSFNEYLRKDVNLNEEKYYYCPQKIGEGKILEGPAIKALRLKNIATNNSTN